MFEIPSIEGITEVAISGEVVDGKAKPLYIYGEDKEEKGKSAL
jgi:ATP-dependent Clp protease ATP-binding subunit ClpX